jgi:vacuolar-type H+-ATPase subunit H
MILDIVKQIKSTEENSKDSLKNAQIQAKQVIESARLKSKEISDKSQIEVKNERKILFEVAVKKANNKIIELRKSNDEKIEKIRNITNKNEELAKKHIINNFIGK